MRVTINIVLINLLAISSFAQIGGRSVYEFVNLPNSPKAAALGGQIISHYSNDLSLAYYNPALLNPGMHNHLTLNYVNYFMDINHGYIAYAPTSNKFENIAAGIHFINYGKFIEADYTGNITGEFGASEYAINLSWAKNIDSLFSVGISIKPIISSFERYLSLGMAGDFGISYHNSQSLLTAGLVMRNVGLQLKTYAGMREPLPFEIQLGITKKLLHAPFRVNFLFHHIETFDLTYDLPLDYNPIYLFAQENTARNKLEVISDKVLRHLNLGVEFVPTKNFYFALGYNIQRSKELRISAKTSTVGLSWGFGMKISKFQIGYSRSTYHLAGSTNQFSITTNLSELITRKQQ